MQFSHSRIECFNHCKFQYKMRYVDRLKTLPNTDPDNALILGQALHTGIEEGVEAARQFYINSFPMLTDDHINELIKLEYIIPVARAALPTGGIYEQKIDDPDFVGFSDLLVPVEWPMGEPEPTVYDLYDFKYSNAVDRYMASGQLHLYKYFWEKTHPGKSIRKMFFAFVPKVAIRPRKVETLCQFRNRIMEKLKESEVVIRQVTYQFDKVVDFMRTVKHALEITDYPREPSRLCGWCEYEDYCLKGNDYMLLPENKRREVDATQKKVIWLFGAPFSGKTFFANSFPDPIMLNTDGNVKFVDAPFIAIHDEVTVEGRLTKTVLAYDKFKDAVAELEKKQNDFKTIVVDLLEDCYEACRVYICDRQGWKHESDDSFKAWDMVRTEFLNTLKRLVALDYENIILISHEDRTKDLTRKTGDKISSIKPNLGDKVANKIAGMVDLVARVVADGDDRVLAFKPSEVIFGGGRLTVRDKEIPLDYEAFCEVYQEANRNAVAAVSRAPQPSIQDPGETPARSTDKPTRRRKSATSDAMQGQAVETPALPEDMPTPEPDAPVTPADQPPFDVPTDAEPVIATAPLDPSPVVRHTRKKRTE